MKIDRIELYHVALPLRAPWRTAYGSDATVETVLCRMVSGDAEAWGEASPLAAPTYSPEWAAGVFLMCRDWLAPRILNNPNIDSGEQLQDLLRCFKGNHFAKAVLDVTWWNLAATIRHVPLWRMLGGQSPQVYVGADFGIADSLDTLLQQIDMAVQQRFKRIKLKCGRGWDQNMLTVVRQAYPSQTFHVDCNASYTLNDLPLFRWMDELGLAMIEQPLRHDDLYDHARLQRQLITPVCLDESVCHLAHAQTALALKACRYLNIKPGRVGGLTPALLIHDLYQQARIPCWVGGMLESGVGASICLSLATLSNFTYPADVFPSSRFYDDDLAEPALTLEYDPQGFPMLHAPATIPTPRPERLKQWCLQKATVCDKTQILKP